MIVRLIVAYVRWIWGLSPAFYQIPTPIENPGDGFLILYGALIDAAVVVAIVIWLLELIKRRKRRRDGED